MSDEHIEKQILNGIDLRMFWTICLAILGLGIVWGTLNGRVEAQEKAIELNKKANSEILDRVDEDHDRIIRIEESSIKVEEKLDDFISEQRNVNREILKRLNERQNQR